MTPESAWMTLSVLISSLGLLGMLVCRMGERSDRCWLYRLLFFLAMLLVAATTLGSLAANSSTWIFSGATLAAMAVGATWQIGPQVASEIGR
jgi:cell division protein FtsW (lipid II flippase)